MNHLKLLKFTNPANKNVCFSNAIVSALLNIPIINNFLSEKSKQMKLYISKNKIIEELVVTVSQILVMFQLKRSDQLYLFFVKKVDR